MAKKLNKKVAIIGITLLVLMIAVGGGLLTYRQIRRNPDRALNLAHQALECFVTLHVGVRKTDAKMTVVIGPGCKTHRHLIHPVRISGHQMDAVYLRLSPFG